MQVDVVVRGDEAAARLCGKLSRRLHDGTPIFRSLVDQVLDAQTERFRGRGQRWRKLSRATHRIDEEQGRDPRPLVLTGELMRSLTVRGHRDQIVRISPTTLTFGTRVYYAKFHHRGTGVPKRTVVGLSRVQKVRVLDELRHLLLEDL